MIMYQNRTILYRIKILALLLTFMVTPIFATTLSCSNGYTKLVRDIWTAGRNDSNNLVTNLFFLDGEASIVDIEKVWTYDSNTHQQAYEQFKVVFTNDANLIMASTDYTTDIVNEGNHNHQFSNLGRITVPEQTTTALLVHRADRTYGENLSDYNSVTFKGMCYKVIKDEKAELGIEVSTNGEDADNPTGPEVDVGSIVTWEYVVKNIGNVELKDVVITDSKLNEICTIKTLAVSESRTCSQTGIATEGQYSNTGTAKGKSPNNVEVKQSDKSHYLGKKVIINFPVAKDDKKEGEKGQAVTVDVLLNDKGVESELNPKSVLFIESNCTDNGKKLIVDGEGVWSINKITGHITFTPENGFVENPTPVIYTVEDMNGNLSNKAVVTIVYPEPQEASLGNFVWFDADRNGQQDQGEVGLEGVTVELYNASDELSQTTVTDENGTYGFGNLDAGEYSLKFVTKEGYSLTMPDTEGISDTLDSDADKVTGRTGDITLSEGEHNVSFDAGMYITPKPSIEVVKTTNNGNVANIIVGDKITWKYVITNTGNSILTHITVQDDKEGLISNCQGSGSLELLSPKQRITCTEVGTAILGAYSNTVVVKAKSEEGTSVEDTDSSSYVGQSTPIKLIKVGDYIWLDSNRNGIQDDTELPLKDVSVELYSADRKLISSTKSNAEGLYGFDDVEPGKYYLKFGIPSGYSVTKKDAGSNRGKDSNAYTNGKTPVFTLLEGKDDLSIDLGLHPTLTNLGDRVFLDSNANGIQDSDENTGVENITVKLYTESNTFVKETKTTSTGHYLFRNLVPANYYIVFGVPNSYKVSP
ncbi:MAG TPA: hypothetical protein ENK82_05915, partial [Campylobacterales bacterium]|nr:hypothetical protein [Campylobacterales bacterium]